MRLTLTLFCNYNEIMENQFERSELLLGFNSTKILSEKSALIFGVGGVGGYAIEALARSGVGKFMLVDNDRINITNINRQIIALHSTIGKYKTIVMKERILDINPNAIVETRETFYLPENRADFDFGSFSYVIDCIDTVSAKIDIAKYCDDFNIPLISAMGAGNKFDPKRFEIADIYDTSVCPLCKVMRRELKKRNVKKLKVLFSKEEPQMRPCPVDDNGKRQRMVTASLPYVPPVAGLIIASEVIKDLLDLKY